jgi:hypothetical protein
MKGRNGIRINEKSQIQIRNKCDANQQIFSYWIGSEHLPPDLALGERPKALFNKKPCVQDSVHSTAGQMLQRCSRAQSIQPTAHSLFMDIDFLQHLKENTITT